VVSWYLADALGTVRDLINNSGAVIDHVDFSAFGTVLDESSPTSGDRFVGFAMLERDTVTGLNLAVEREENPGTGRWDSEDPAGFAAGDPDLFGYVVNDPVGGTDSAGLGPWGWPSWDDYKFYANPRNAGDPAWGNWLGWKGAKTGGYVVGTAGLVYLGTRVAGPVAGGVARASGAAGRAGVVSIRVVRTVWKYGNRIARWKRTKTDECEAPNAAPRMRDVIEASKTTAGTPAQKADAMQPLLDQINKANPGISAERFQNGFGSGFSGSQGDIIFAAKDGVTYVGRVSGKNLMDLVTGAKHPSQIPGINPAR
jgi:RHS repeat-associated protein